MREGPSALNATDAIKLIRQGELTPEELLESCIARIEQLDPVVNAMITRAYEQAREQAHRATLAVSRGDPLGALHGLPVAIKDIQATRGIRTTYGSEAFARHIPQIDAGIVQRIRNAGGIIIGKTNIPESSIGANTVNRLFGATGNPFSPHLTCGGSSGGSAVAVATHMAPLATGSDHGGSLRIPACYSGVVGYRATPGVVPNEGRSTTQTNYSVQGPIARSVGDVALLLSVIAQRDQNASMDPMAYPLDAAQLSQLDDVDISRLRVAVTVDLGGVLVSETIRRTFTERMNLLAPMFGACDWHDIDLTEAPNVDWHLRQDLFVAQYIEQASSWDVGFNPNVQSTYRSALDTPMVAIASARRRQMALFQAFRRIFDHYDLVLCPGVSIPPFSWRHLNPQEIDGKPVTNYMAWLALTSSLTVVGHPVIALPCGLDEQGTPFGIQAVGAMYSDQRLLSAAQALERQFSRMPALARPTPDFDQLGRTSSACRTEGRIAPFVN